MRVIDIPAHPPLRPDGSLNFEQLAREYHGTGNKHLSDCDELLAEYGAACAGVVILRELGETLVS
jgi:hypothetical protein